MVSLESHGSWNNDALNANVYGQGAYHALRPEELRCGVRFLVSVAGWIQPKLYSLAQISTHGPVDLPPQVYANLQPWSTPDELPA